MAEALNTAAFSELITSIYDCVLDPDRWEPTLIDINSALWCHSSILHLNDLRRDRFLIYRPVGIDAHWQKRQNAYLPEIHALLNEALGASPSLDEPLVLTRTVSRSRYETSPYVQEYLRPQGLVDTLQLLAIGTSTRLAGLGMARDEHRALSLSEKLSLRVCCRRTSGAR